MSEVEETAREIERYAHSVAGGPGVQPGEPGARQAALARVYDALELSRRAEELLSATARAARDYGCTWQEIGDVVGVTRQAAFQRFGKPIDPRTGAPMQKTTIAHADVMALDLLEKITTGEWAQACARFDETMSAALSESALADAWASVVALHGERESTGTPFVRGHGLHTVVDVPFEQEAGEMVFRVAFDADGRIAGLFFLNPDAASKEL
ncbi:DUF3887 domain-containing protein [Gordonia paraffinivorans]|uniref:DUF3887 domain-containing protein n=1 Tax=Gordonia paraffinivorans TaxID=175628 RepID=UPI000D612E12|nr:DUF3887 domain-containing protein [Gordonia paraffinivorans]MBY4574371.1 DUF3887 domain-containing protein [Gordonia paraffinivorans]PWD44454.1 DUF3887 domain-containing protein [Gordonia paraffinivorans]